VISSKGVEPQSICGFLAIGMKGGPTQNNPPYNLNNFQIFSSKIYYDATNLLNHHFLFIPNATTYKNPITPPNPIRNR
jgi:hypothetical protein